MKRTSSFYALTGNALHSLVDGTMDNVVLLLLGELDEVYGVAGNADGQLRILFRVVHRVEQRFALEHVHVQVMAVLREVAVQQRNQVRLLFRRGFPSESGTMLKV